MSNDKNIVPVDSFAAATLAVPTVPPTIMFHAADSVEVGRLNVGPPMNFEGDVDESGRIFFESICIRGNNLYQQIADLKANNAKLQGQIDYWADIRAESEGVAGYHLNGDLAPWSEFEYTEGDE